MSAGNVLGELEELQKIHKLFADAEAFEAPYGFSTRVLANIRAKETRSFGGLSTSLQNQPRVLPCLY